MDEDKESIFLELQSAIEMLRKNYLSTNNKTVSEEEMVRNGLAAMLATLGDPFTNYIPPDQLTSYQARKAQQIVGVGLVSEFDREGKARIVAALESSPAFESGMPVGAEIFRINGRNIRKTSSQLLANSLNGPEGSTVDIELIMDSGETASFQMQRRSVNVEYVRFQLIDPSILFIRIAWFSGTCYQELIDQLGKHIESGVKGIVLDVRTNSGGSMISTRNIFSAFCDQEVMYYCRKTEDEKIKDKILGQHYFNLPIVLILNEQTFSAGEILAGSLKDYGRAKLVGRRSGGKGSMQQVFPLEGRIAGALRITTATNCTPEGYVIQGNGVEPDIEVEQDLSELFVDDGAQNYARDGREYLKVLRSEKLAMIHGRERVEQVLGQGDKQKKCAIETLRAEITKGQ